MDARRYAVPTAERRVWRYWFVDGLPNLVAGLICIFLAAGFIVFAHQGQTHTKSPLLIAAAVIVMVIYIIVFARLRQTIELLKTRITYPRTGYAAPPRFTFTMNEPLPADLVMLNLSRAPKQGILPDTLEMVNINQDRRRWMWIALTIYLAAFLSAAFIHQPSICGALGIATSFGILAATRKNERASWALAFGLPYAGMFIFTVAGPYHRQLRVDRLGFFLAGAGLALALTGALELARYLRRNPKVQVRT